MLRLPLKVFLIVPISSLLHRAPAEEAKRLAEHIFGPLRATTFKGRTRAEEMRSKNTTQTGMVSVKDELNIALHVEEENALEQALQVDIEASVEPKGRKTVGFR